MGNEDVIWAVYNDWKRGWDLFSTAIIKRTPRGVYIDSRSAGLPFRCRSRLRPEEVHTDPRACLEDFIAHKQAECDRLDKQRAAAVEAVRWATERLRIEAFPTPSPHSENGS